MAGCSSSLLLQLTHISIVVVFPAIFVRFNNGNGFFSIRIHRMFCKKKPPYQAIFSLWCTITDCQLSAERYYQLRYETMLSDSRYLRKFRRESFDYSCYRQISALNIQSEMRFRLSELFLTMSQHIFRIIHSLLL